MYLYFLVAVLHQIPTEVQLVRYTFDIFQSEEKLRAKPVVARESGPHLGAAAPAGQHRLQHRGRVRQQGVHQGTIH